MKTVLVINSSFFPTGVAMSSRILNFCRLFRDLDYQVHVITAHTEGIYDVGKKYMIEGISYEVISDNNGDSIESFIGIHGFPNRVKTYINDNNPDVVFMTSSVGMFRRLTKIFKQFRTPFFVEQCEWLDLSSYRFGKYDLRYINTEHLRKKGAKHANGVVTISRLLDNYYRDQGVRSIRVPTILDVKNSPCKDHSNFNQPIHIVFAGSLGASKEMMKPIIEALAQNQQFRERIVFDVYGPSKKQIIENIGGDSILLDMVERSLVIHGRVSQEQIPDVYSNSDFLIFVRPQRRSSDAGFPTKFAESMAVGTPVITNNTGDIGLYLRNGENGFLLQNNTTEAVCECFNTLISINNEKYAQLSYSARKTAEECFDYRVYKDEISKFFSL